MKSKGGKSTEAKAEGFENHDLAWLKLGELTVDPTYQRGPKSGHIRNIAENFDQDAFGTPVISSRKDGMNATIDGQQRTLALRLLGWSDEAMIPCIVKYGLTIEDEAALFGKLNKTKNMSTYEKFRARYVAKDQAAVEIVGIARGCGLSFFPGENAPVIGAVGACEKIYGGYRSKVRHKCGHILRMTLETILSAFDPNREALSGPMIVGVGLVILNYYSRSGINFDLDRLKTKLNYHQYTASNLILAGRGRSEHLGGSIPDGVASEIVEIYNKGLRSELQRLPPWRSI